MTYYDFCTDINIVKLSHKHYLVSSGKTYYGHNNYIQSCNLHHVTK